MQFNFKGPLSSSVDNISPKSRVLGPKRPEIKPVLPPMVKARINNSKTSNTWTIDNSWRFIGKRLLFFSIHSLHNSTLHPWILSPITILQPILSCFVYIYQTKDNS